MSVDRLLLVALAAAMFALLIGLVRWRAARLSRSVVQRPAGALWDALRASPDGRPTVVEFSTPACGECRVQASELAQLEGARYRVLHIDAARQPDVARAFGVLTAPSTVVLDDAGRVRHLNRTLATVDTLRAQLTGGGSASAAG